MAIKRKSYSTLFKLKAVQFALEHGTLAAALHCEVSERLIRRWKADKENLEDMPLVKRANRFGKQKVEEIDDAVYSWIVQRRKASRAVLLKDIRAKALQLARESSRQDFKASASWCKLFTKRKNLVLKRRTNVGQLRPEDYEENCKNIRGFVSPHFENFKEVAMPFDMVHARTVKRVVANAIRHENSITAVIPVTAAAEKLKPMIIFKEKKIPKDSFLSEMIVKASDKGWMNQDFMRIWLLEEWDKRQRCSNDPSQSLLVLDSARCHLTESVQQLFKEHSKIAVIPDEMAKYLQPPDVGIKKPFKDNVRAGWEQWMEDPARARHQNRH